MFDAFAKVAQKRAEKKKAEQEAKKNYRKPDMMDPKNYEDSMGVYEFFKTKKDMDDEEENS